MGKSKDLEFSVDGDSGEKIFKEFDEALAFAVQRSVSRGGEEVNLDVLCWSKAAAKAWGGDYAVEQYEEDPDASVSERIVIRAESVGRIA